jgi:hypothetical protein
VHEYKSDCNDHTHGHKSSTHFIGIDFLFAVKSDGEKRVPGELSLSSMNALDAIYDAPLHSIFVRTIYVCDAAGTHERVFYAVVALFQTRLFLRWACIVFACQPLFVCVSEEGCKPFRCLPAAGGGLEHTRN